LGPRSGLDDVEKRKITGLSQTRISLSFVPLLYNDDDANDNSKINLSLCLINQALRHKGLWVVGVEIQVFLNSALVGGEWSASRPGRFTPGEREPGTHWIGGWVGPRTGLEDTEN
jgi:hypothetical protein